MASYTANNYGLYDVHGNVYEWVEDCLSNNYANSPKNGEPILVDSSKCFLRVLRGGSWFDNPGSLRLAWRYSKSPWDLSSIIGFRVAAD